MHQMGFLAKRVTKGKTVPQITNENCVLRFDSGNGVSQADASHHMLVMGTTGSGKTASVVLPVLQQLIAAGHCGLVVDIKGNLREQTRTLARHCGREADVVEYGTAPTATPLNLLQGMTMHEVRGFLEILTMQHFQGDSNNKDFHMKGVHQASDCIQLLHYAAVKNEALAPSLGLLAEMLDDTELAAGLFTLFMKSAYDAADIEQRRFVQRVKSNEFHILGYSADKARKSTNYLEQVNYAIQAVRIALASFTDAPGVMRGFASHAAQGAAMRRLLQEKKIVLLRFGPDTGPIGAQLARMMLQEYYKAVFADGLSMPEGCYSFTCLDEFQEFADLSAGRFSDTSFIAQAREFHSIFLASTQSVSALVNKGRSPAAVGAFISNCNTRIVFYSDDINTQQLAAQYDPTARLNNLHSGEAFVVQYNTETRKHRFGLESLQRAYATTQNVLQQSCHQRVAPAPDGQDMPPPSLFAIVEQERAKHESQNPKPSPEVMELPGGIKGETMRKHLAYKAQGFGAKQQESVEDVKVQPAKAEVPCPAEVEAARLLQRYPQFFSSSPDLCVLVPMGWLEYTEKALHTFAHTGFPLNIVFMSERRGALVVHSMLPTGLTERQISAYQMGERFLDSLLEGTRYLCPLCGAHIGRKKGAHAQDTAFTLCRTCARQHDLLPGTRQRRNAGQHAACTGL